MVVHRTCFDLFVQECLNSREFHAAEDGHSALYFGMWRRNVCLIPCAVLITVSNLTVEVFIPFVCLLFHFLFDLDSI